MLPLVLPSSPTAQALPLLPCHTASILRGPRHPDPVSSRSLLLSLSTAASQPPLHLAAWRCVPQSVGLRTLVPRSLLGSPVESFPPRLPRGSFHPSHSGSSGPETALPDQGPLNPSLAAPLTPAPLRPCWSWADISSLGLLCRGGAGGRQGWVWGCRHFLGHPCYFFFSGDRHPPPLPPARPAPPTPGSCSLVLSHGSGRLVVGGGGLAGRDLGELAVLWQWQGRGLHGN